MNTNPTHYGILNPDHYRVLAQRLIPKLAELGENRVTFKNEIHRHSRFAICHYIIKKKNDDYILDYDEAQSVTTSNQKKTDTDPSILNDIDVKNLVAQFLRDINDASIIRAEVKLIQTDTFPFIFNPHRDSQFKRLRNITYLATVILSAGGIEGGNMQLFHSDNDKLGPFNVMEELPVEPGVGYVVDERPQVIFHGMKAAYKTEPAAHRAALLIRFF